MPAYALHNCSILRRRRMNFERTRTGRSVRPLSLSSWRLLPSVPSLPCFVQLPNIDGLNVKWRTMLIAIRQDREPDDETGSSHSLIFGKGALDKA
mgnify:CR=1 FL=1